MTTIDISGLDKASVLSLLYGHAVNPIHGKRKRLPGCTAMHVSAARAILKTKGLKIKRLGWYRLDIDLSGDEFDPTAYDHHRLGTGSFKAERIIAYMRDAEEYVRSLEPSGSCPNNELPSTRFLQLRLMFGGWYFIKRKYLVGTLQYHWAQLHKKPTAAFGS